MYARYCKTPGMRCGDQFISLTEKESFPVPLGARKNFPEDVMLELSPEGQWDNHPVSAGTLINLYMS